MDIKKIKNDFPIFRHHNQKPLVYLDSAATAQKPQAVIDALCRFYQEKNANIHRGLYALSEDATVEFEAARNKIATFINAASSTEVVFTKGTTEGINFVASAYAAQHLQPGDEILLTHVEHHANLLPWQRVASQTGAILRFIPLNHEQLHLEFHDDLISSKTKIVAVTQSSNTLGNVWQDAQTLCTLIKKAHAVGAKVLIDAAQTVMQEKLDVQTLGADFVVFSGHKMLGPTGIGILFIKKDLHDSVQPYQLGGSMVHEVTFETATWARAPHKFEAGTPPIASAVGLGAAVDYITSHIDYHALREHYALLQNQLLNGVEDIKQVTPQLNSHRANHVISFTTQNIHAHDLAAALAQDNIAVRAGHLCAQPLVTMLGQPALLRVSFAPYTTADDISTFCEHLARGINLFSK
jgi:cysteine desulfurase/selenocysteine lyase